MSGSPASWALSARLGFKPCVAYGLGLLGEPALVRHLELDLHQPPTGRERSAGHHHQIATLSVAGH